MMVINILDMYPDFVYFTLSHATLIKYLNSVVNLLRNTLSTVFFNQFCIVFYDKCK